MSILQTLLVFGGIPLAVVLVVAALVYGPGERQHPRYRPGRPFEFTPVWFLAAAEEQHSSRTHPALEAERARVALNPGRHGQPDPPGRTGVKGGARGAW